MPLKKRFTLLVVLSILFLVHTFCGAQPENPEEIPSNDIETNPIPEEQVDYTMPEFSEIIEMRHTDLDPQVEELKNEDGRIREQNTVFQENMERLRESQEKARIATQKVTKRVKVHELVAENEKSMNQSYLFLGFIILLSIIFVGFIIIKTRRN